MCWQRIEYEREATAKIEAAQAALKKLEDDKKAHDAAEDAKAASLQAELTLLSKKTDMQAYALSNKATKMEMHAALEGKADKQEVTSVKVACTPTLKPFAHPRSPPVHLTSAQLSSAHLSRLLRRRSRSWRGAASRRRMWSTTTLTS